MCDAVQCSTVQCRTVQQSSVHNSTAQCSTLTSSGSMPCFLICILPAPPSPPPCGLLAFWPGLPASTPHSSGSKRCAGHAADNCALSLTSPITLPCYPFHVVMEGTVHQPSPAITSHHPPPPSHLLWVQSLLLDHVEVNTLKQQVARVSLAKACNRSNDTTTNGQRTMTYDSSA